MKSHRNKALEQQVKAWNRSPRTAFVDGPKEFDPADTITVDCDPGLIVWVHEER